MEREREGRREGEGAKALGRALPHWFCETRYVTCGASLRAISGLGEEGTGLFSRPVVTARESSQPGH